MAAVQQRRTMGIALALTSASLALLVWSVTTHARDPATPKDNSETKRIIAIGGLSHWLKGRFSEAELAALRPEDLDIESHYCGCYDKPKAHFPYSFFLLRTPKGDLVARPDSSEGALTFALLAVRYGDRYCQVESEEDCYGSFAGALRLYRFPLWPAPAEFFPTCNSDETEPVRETKRPPSTSRNGGYCERRMSEHVSPGDSEVARETRDRYRRAITLREKVSTRRY